MSSRSRSGSTTSPENVVRPAAHEWDEREEFPWPIVQEAAQIGLYGFDFVATSFAEPPASCCRWRPRSCSGATPGIGLAIFGSGAGGRGDQRGRHARAGPGVGAAVLRHADDVKLGAFCVSEPDAGSDVSSLRTRAVYDEANDEWVLNGTKAWITNGGIADVHVVVAAVDPDAEGPRPGLVRGAAGHGGAVTGPEVQEARHPCVAHGRGRARRRAGAGPLPARRQGAARREAGPGPRGGPLGREAAGDVDVRGDPARPSARRPSASPAPPTSTRSTTPRSARRSASRSS